MKRGFFFLVASLAILSAAPLSAEVSMVPLGVPSTPGRPPGEVVASAINASGLVVGHYLTDDEYVWAFTWTRSRGFSLFMENAFAADVNDHGDIVGHYYACPPPLPDQESSCPRRGFLWDADTGVVDLG